MPTIDCNLTDLHMLIGQPLTLAELDEALAFVKGEVDSNDPATGDIRISLEDTNQPYLWSAEGIALALRSVLGIEKVASKPEIKASKDEIIVDPSVKTVRPYIAVFSAKGSGVTDAFLRQLIQFQEKFCDAFGMKRAKVSIGIYRHDKVTFPVTYKAVAPDAVRFQPLGSSKPMTPSEILAEHPTGQAYAWTLAKSKTYPILVDKTGKILSLVPIINSNNLGKVETGDSDLMFECTGTDQGAVDLCANIFSHALWMRGFEICSATIVDGKNKTRQPRLQTEDIKLSVAAVNQTLGTAFRQQDLKDLLERIRHIVKKDGPGGLIVTVPSYRADVIHPVDLIEDCAIMADYNTLPTHPLTSYTIGDVKPIERTIDTVRDLLAGQGMQEILSPVLCTKELLYKRMDCDDVGTIEIKEFMSASYSCVRSWLTPILIDVLSKNLHREYPQNLFETGEVCCRAGGHVLEQEHAAVTLCNHGTDYTRIRQVLDCILETMGFGNITYESLEETHTTFGWVHGAFIPGRASVCRVKGTAIAVIGEIHPAVLDNFSIRMPVAALELDLNKLHDLRENR